MPDNLRESKTSIITLNGSLALGVKLTRDGIQRVDLDVPVTEWTIKKVEGKTDTYLLSIGNYAYTYPEDDGVFASIFNDPSQARDWVITYVAQQDAYTIAAASNPNAFWWVEGDPAVPTSLKLQIQCIDTPLRAPLSDSQIFRFELVERETNVGQEEPVCQISVEL